VIGHSKSQIGRLKKSLNFREKISESQRGVQVMNNAVTDLSLQCDPGDAGRGLYLITAPAKEMDMNLVRDVGAHLKRIAPEAIIRTGDYPREKGSLNITIILSEIVNVSKIANYFTQTIDLMATIKKKREGVDTEYKNIEDAFRDIPSLL